MIRRVTVRLTLWYMGLFTLMLAVIFVLIQLRLSAILNQGIEKKMFGELTENKWVGKNSGENHQKTDESFKWQAKIEGIKKIFYVLLSPELDLLAQSDLTPWSDLDFKKWGVPFLTDDKEELEAYLTGRKFSNKVCYHKLKIGKIAACRESVLDSSKTKALIGYLKFENGNTLAIGLSLDENRQFLAGYRKLFAVTFLIMLPFGGLLGFFMAKRAMSGVERVTQTAVRIGRGDLNHRVPIGKEGEEIQHLAIAFNDMLERIHALVTELKEVSNNIAHDLRSPITRIRGIAETTITGNSNLAEYKKMSGITVEECDRLINMINTMLEIAETDSGVVEIVKSRVNIVDVLNNAHDLFLSVADDNQVHLFMDRTEPELFVKGQPSRLQRMVANILDNAIKYTDVDGEVHIKAVEKNGCVDITIRDSGLGIRSEELPRIFDRFYRCDRSRSTYGNGLGLSLAQSIARAHGGEITVNSIYGEGSEFKIVLPKA